MSMERADMDVAEQRAEIAGEVAERKRQKSERARQRRREREQAMRDCGLVKVRGALGGVYWE